MKYKHIISIVWLIIISGCRTTNITSHKDSDITITKSGIEAIGTGISQNERISNSIATRLARTNLLEYINLALAKTDKELGLSIGTHTEDKLQGSKVIETTQYKQRKNIITIAHVEINNDKIHQWIDSYYEALPADDTLRIQTSKNSFSKLIYKHLNINL